MAKARVSWTERERVLLAEKMLEYLEQGYSKLAALRQAQELHLPADRRRNVPAVTQLAWLPTYLHNAQIKRDPPNPKAAVLNAVVDTPAHSTEAPVRGSSEGLLSEALAPALEQLKAVFANALAEVVSSALTSDKVKLALGELFSSAVHSAFSPIAEPVASPLSTQDAVPGIPIPAINIDDTPKASAPLVPEVQGEPLSPSAEFASALEPSVTLDTPAVVAELPVAPEVVPAALPVVALPAKATEAIPATPDKSSGRKRGGSTAKSVPATSREKAVADKPSPKTAPRLRSSATQVAKRKVLIVGLIGPQIDEMQKKFGEAADLKFWQTSESAAQLRKMAKSCEVAIGVVDFMPHSADTALKDCSPSYIRHAGGIKRLKDTLSAVLKGTRATPSKAEAPA